MPSHVDSTRHHQCRTPHYKERTIRLVAHNRHMAEAMAHTTINTRIIRMVQGEPIINRPGWHEYIVHITD